MEERDVCLKCGEGTLQKPRVFFRVFEGRKQPDGVCEHCGSFSWNHLNPITFISTSKTAEKREPTFAELLEIDERKKKKKREKSRV